MQITAVDYELGFSHTLFTAGTCHGIKDEINRLINSGTQRAKSSSAGNKSIPKCSNQVHTVTVNQVTVKFKT